MKIFSARGMPKRPRLHEMFRVGKYVGTCVCSTPWFVIMKGE